MSDMNLAAAIEAMLFACGDAVEDSRLISALSTEEEPLDKKTFKAAIAELMEKYESEDRGIRLLFLDGKYQLCTKNEYFDVLSKLVNIPKKHSLTDVLLETLSIVAYKQPVTRAEIEKIRGVDCSHAVSKLVEYQLVEEIGRLDAPGKPMLFGTTEEFLRSFGVTSLDELPALNPVSR